MKISVALCTYNGQNFIRQQLDSILSQTHKVDEICIFDDASTDNTYEILQQYQQQHPSVIQIKKNLRNLQCVKNFEQALSACTGEIIFLSDQDDIWVPRKVEEYIAYFKNGPHLNALCSNGYLIDDQEKVTDNIITIWDVPTIIQQHGRPFDYFNCISYVGNVATGASMAIRKSFLKRILPIPLVDIMLHDEWIALMASMEKGFEIIDKKLFYYRIHTSQQIGIVALPDNEKSRQLLFKKYSALKKDSFKEIKISLKSIVYRNDQLLAYQHDPSLKPMREAIRKDYKELRTLSVKKYPAKGILLMVTDFITRKRRFR